MIRHRLVIRLGKGFVVLCMCLVACVVLDSCSSSKKTVSGSESVRVDKSKKKKKKPKAGRGASHALADALVDEARSWIGTPYRYGGKTKKGADCSGFTMEVFRNVAGIAIPRNSAKQKEYCADIDKKDLTVGDLVFFSSKRSGGSIAHVGMYIGDGKMIHASSSRGVVESSIEQRYYVEHYKGSGRIPLIAELVPVKKRPSSADRPTPEPPQYADSDRKSEPKSEPRTDLTPVASVRAENVDDLLNGVEKQPQTSVSSSIADVRTAVDEKPNVDAPESHDADTELATVTVESAFDDDSETTRAPLTSQPATPATSKKAAKTAKSTRPESPKTVKPAVKTPEAVVRNAFGVKK